MAKEDLETKVSKILKRVEKGQLSAEEAQTLISAERDKGSYNYKKAGKIEKTKEGPRKSHGVRNLFLILLGIGALWGIAKYCGKLTEQEQSSVEYKNEQSKPGISNEQEKKQYEPNEPARQTTEQEEQGPKIYGMNEWVKDINDGLEFKVNRAYRRVITEKEIYPDVGFEKVYYDLLIVNYTAKGTSSEPSRVEASWFQIVYPSNCKPLMHRNPPGIEQKILELLNGGSHLSKEVTCHSSWDFSLPYLIRTNVEGFEADYVPRDDILRVSKVPGVGQVEIGSFEE